MIFVPIGYPGWQLFNSFQLSMYTAPAIFACMVNVVAIFTMLFVFEERYAGLANEKVSNLKLGKRASICLIVVLGEKKRRKSLYSTL